MLKVGNSTMHCASSRAKYTYSTAEEKEGAMVDKILNSNRSNDPLTLFLGWSRGVAIWTAMFNNNKVIYMQIEVPQVAEKAK